ncbi:MAG: hypothetical protein GQ527_05895 [Bacteroidales bacterium]|nr:hypothetical protein [Bacteroidales bacterium]
MITIVLSVFAVLIMLSTFYFRRPIYALSLKLIFGEFHEKYMSLFFHGANYESNYLKEELSSQIVNMKNALNSRKKIKAQKPIYFQDIEYGISTRKLISRLGKPYSSDLLDLGDIKVVVLEYHIKPNNVIDKYNYYFYKDRYYSGEFLFNKVGTDTSEQIIDSIQSKYGVKNTNNDYFVLNDKKRNLLAFNDHGYSVSVSYFNGENPDIVDLIACQNRREKETKSLYDVNINIQELSF